ncbi:hypothetical protein GcC1_007003 [Golovinomyces cichoracearum]|uniref:Uncharacterized protein n=1 Tax=Golovinomyces cichoracearum TaxID=62708 RepID=A0A420J8B6_9PEZI|nr:hypothetical protein GcC1_007003 [Golovinomyces cichoracearum]
MEELDFQIGRNRANFDNDKYFDIGPGYLLNNLTYRPKDLHAVSSFAFFNFASVEDADKRSISEIPPVKFPRTICVDRPKSQSCKFGSSRRRLYIAQKFDCEIWESPILPISSSHTPDHIRCCQLDDLSLSPDNSKSPSASLLSEIFIPSLTLTSPVNTIPTSPSEIWVPNLLSSRVNQKPKVQSPKSYLKCKSRKRYLADLDKKIVKWVTQTDPIIEQWEIYARIHDETGYLFNSTWVMKRLHLMYLSRTPKSIPLAQCKIYNRLQRIKDKLTTLDWLPGVEDQYFGKSMKEKKSRYSIVS